MAKRKHPTIGQVRYWKARAVKAEAQRDLALQLVQNADTAKRLLAKLAARTPQFDSPLAVMMAEALRDAILTEKGPPNG